ncbi:putative aldo/keto reductase, partial [Thozetella sp. PMI_491]
MPLLVGKEITQNGLGLMRDGHGTSITDEQAFKVLKAALERGVNVWNGADFYGTPENNSLHLMNRYFATHPKDADKVVLSIKTGVVDMRSFAVDCSPEAMRRFAENANKILDGKKKIDLFGPARVDKKVPIEDTVAAVAELVKEGVVGGIQLSEVSSDTIRRASKVAKIDMVEQEVSIWADEIFHNGVAETCGELGIVIEAHTPLGAGMLTGHLKGPEDLPANDYHRFFPRFQPENFAKNLELVTELEKLAKVKGCTTAQLALCWIKSKSRGVGMPILVPIFGASSEARISENTLEVSMKDEEMAKINDILSTFEVAGTRYPTPGMALIE